jgi:hypothetical protein
MNYVTFYCQRDSSKQHLEVKHDHKFMKKSLLSNYNFIQITQKETNKKVKKKHFSV